MKKKFYNLYSKNSKLFPFDLCDGAAWVREVAYLPGVQTVQREAATKRHARQAAQARSLYCQSPLRFKEKKMSKKGELRMDLKCVARTRGARSRPHRDQPLNKVNTRPSSGPARFSDGRLMKVGARRRGAQPAIRPRPARQ